VRRIRQWGFDLFDRLLVLADQETVVSADATVEGRDQSLARGGKPGTAEIGQTPRAGFARRGMNGAMRYAYSPCALRVPSVERADALRITSTRRANLVRPAIRSPRHRSLHRQVRTRERNARCDQ
jgi:hypothetical protein